MIKKIIGIGLLSSFLLASSYMPYIGYSIYSNKSEKDNDIIIGTYVNIFQNKQESLEFDIEMNTIAYKDTNLSDYRQLDFTLKKNKYEYPYQVSYGTHLIYSQTPTAELDKTGNNKYKNNFSSICFLNGGYWFNSLNKIELGEYVSYYKTDKFISQTDLGYTKFWIINNLSSLQTSLKLSYIRPLKKIENRKSSYLSYSLYLKKYSKDNSYGFEFDFGDKIYKISNYGFVVFNLDQIYKNSYSIFYNYNISEQSSLGLKITKQKFEENDQTNAYSTLFLLSYYTTF